MENASKALIIAGGVFLAIVILVIAVELFVGYAKIAENYEDRLEINEISKINKEFTKYEGREDITIQEIVTAAKTAHKYKERQLIEVLLSGTTGNLADYNNNQIIEIIKKDSDDNVEQNYYKATLESDDNTGLIKIIKFNKVN